MTEKLYALPTSFAQQRLLFLDRFESKGAAYNIPVAVCLTGHLDKMALVDSLNAIVGRHEILRTTFAVLEGESVQVVSQDPPREFKIVMGDLSGLPQSEREAEALRQATIDAQGRFNLSEGPLLRITLFTLGDEENILSLTLHHIICDGWSIGIFIREMAALYEAFLNGMPSPLPELPLQYADYAHWQRQWFQGEPLDRLITYWKRKLVGELPTLELPTDRPRPAIQTFRGAQSYFTVDENLIDALRALSKTEEATLFMTLTAAFSALLHRYSNHQEIIIGTPVANRNQEETESLIGCFVNTLALRIDLSGDPTFKELLARVRQVALEAYAHQDLPFEKLIEELQAPRDLSRSVLFQAMLSLNNTVMPSLRIPELAVRRLRIDRATTPFDLLLLLEDSDNAMEGILQYSADLFEAATIDRILACFKLLLEGIVTNPARRISQLPLLTEAMWRQLVVENNDTNDPYPEDECIHEMFEAQAERTPDAIALVSRDDLLTYRELNARANQLGRYLRSLGVGPEALVGICMERSCNLIIGMLSALKAGAAYVPLDPRYPKDRLAFMLEDARARVLLTEQHLVETLGQQPAPVLPVDSKWDVIAKQSAASLRTSVTPGNLIYVIYTSGSTGKPKGTMIQHRSLVSYTKTVTSGYGVESDDRVLQFCSISFDISAEEIFPCLTRGATLVFRNDEMLESVPTFLETCREWQITMLSLPTSYWHEITAGLNADTSSLPSCLRLVIIAGERALPERLEIWRRSVGQATRLINTYGLTESTIISTLGELTDLPPPDAPVREVSIGKTIRNTQIYILDKHMEPVPLGVSGEIYIGGLLLARGYLGRPEATAGRFAPSPFDQEGARLYRTGDAARSLPDGGLEFVGRIDQQVKIRGFRIELGEVEAALRNHPAVQDAIAVVQSYSPGDKRLVAYLVVGQKAPPSVNELRGFLQGSLPYYMIPSSFLLLDALPLTPNGKVDRQSLPAIDGQLPALAAAYASPSSDLERTIVNVWRETLGLDQVGIDDNFFDLGGHSLLMIQLQNRLTQTIETKISMVELFKYPTVRTLAQYLSDGESEEGLIVITAEEARSRKQARKRRSLRRSTALGEGVRD